ncbi:MAG: DUF4342 domain-containing protein [Clostridiales Family XIII bacterium]|jgi:uncharacterized protein YjbJ (UPF0337 family)|nr:DUF4342 domain-containing protein [Clostridiales Family XIII bacterium]
MEITLEKIELVKDRTGVSYKEAKEALEAADGNVVDAIIAIEEVVNQRAYTKISDNSAKVVEKIREYIAKGNVSRIIVRKDGDVMLNVPVNAVIVGTILAWWLVTIATVISVGTKCDIELVKTDGTVVDITGKLVEAAGTVKDKSGEAFEAVRTKAQGTADKAKSVRDDVAGTASEIKGIVKEAAQDIKETVKKEGAAPEEPAEEAAGEAPKKKAPAKKTAGEEAKAKKGKKAE